MSSMMQKNVDFVNQPVGADELLKAMHAVMHRLRAQRELAEQALAGVGAEDRARRLPPPCPHSLRAQRNPM